MRSAALKAVVANDGMEISFHLPPGSHMATRLRAEADRLKREPGFLLVDIIEAVLGMKTDGDLIGPVLAVNYMIVKHGGSRASALKRAAEVCARKDAAK
jgi:hypothetical protein